MKKLTRDDVVEICKLLNEGRLTLTEIAKRMGVAQANISKIKNGQSWTEITDIHLTSRGGKDREWTKSSLTPEEVVEICKALNRREMSVRAIADKYNVCPGTIAAIQRGKNWKCVSEEILLPTALEKFTLVGKLKQEEIVDICKLISENELSLSEIAKMFNVSHGTISRIRNGKIWKDVSEKHLIGITPKSFVKLTEGCVIEICNLLNAGISASKIAEKYDVAKSTIYGIKNGRIWKEVGDKYLTKDFDIL